MKITLFTILPLLFPLSGCSPRPTLEGPVKFIIYEPEPGDVRHVHSEKAPADFKPNPENSLADLWDCAPYVRLYPDYVELVYHKKRIDGSEDAFTHVIPSSRLRFLRWLDRK